MRYKPERALTLISIPVPKSDTSIVEMRYKPERALTHKSVYLFLLGLRAVEMRYKPERALTPSPAITKLKLYFCRNEV